MLCYEQKIQELLHKKWKILIYDIWKLVWTMQQMPQVCKCSATSPSICNGSKFWINIVCFAHWTKRCTWTVEVEFGPVSLHCDLSLSRWCTETWSPATSSTLMSQGIQSRSGSVTLALPSSCVPTTACWWPRATPLTLWRPRWAGLVQSLFHS